MSLEIFLLLCFPGPENCTMYDPNPQGLVVFYTFILDILSGMVRNCRITKPAKICTNTHLSVFDY